MIKLLFFTVMSFAAIEDQMLDTVSEEKPNSFTFLTAMGIDILYQNNDGENALHRAAVLESTDMAKAVINTARSSDKLTELLNAETRSGNTPMHLAAINNNVEMVRLFYVTGAEHLVPNKKGKTALEIATQNQYKGVIDVLKFDPPELCY